MSNSEFLLPLWHPGGKILTRYKYCGHWCIDIPLVQVEVGSLLVNQGTENKKNRDINAPPLK